MTPDEFRAHFRRIADDVGGAARWGELHDLSRQYVTNVLNGHDPPSPKILTALGMRAHTEYVSDKPAPFVSEFMSELDCTQEDVRVQARWELDRAEERYRLGSLVLFGEWARKWGRAMMRAAETLSDDAEEEIKDVWAQAERDTRENDAKMSRVEGELDDAEKMIAKLEDAITKAVGDLEEIIPVHTSIRTIIERLENP